MMRLEEGTKIKYTFTIDEDGCAVDEDGVCIMSREDLEASVGMFEVIPPDFHYGDVVVHDGHSLVLMRGRKGWSPELDQHIAEGLARGTYIARVLGGELVELVEWDDGEPGASDELDRIMGGIDEPH